MEFAPPDQREVFWRHYNEGRRRSALKATTLDQIAAAWLGRESGLINDGLAQAGRLWRQVVPGEFAGRCQVESLSGRVLCMLVDSKSTAFVLRRSVERMFLDLACGAPAHLQIERVQYRVGKQA